MSNRRTRRKGVGCSETSRVRERVGISEKSIKINATSNVCDTAHTGQIGEPREITAPTPAADDSAGGQTCAPCTTSARHTNPSSASKSALEAADWRLEKITLFSLRCRGPARSHLQAGT